MRVGIKQWAKEAANRIGNVIIKNGLKLNYFGWKQGPHTIVFYVGFKHYPTQGDIQKLTKLSTPISYALGNIPVIIRPNNRQTGFAIQVESPLPRTPVATELVRAGEGFHVALGYDSGREPVMADMDNVPIMAWIGPMGKGKSESVRTTLSILLSRFGPERLSVYIFARKIDEWASFAHLPHLTSVSPAGRKASNIVGPDQAAEWLTHLAFTVFTQRTQQSIEWPRIVVILDDFAGLLRYDKNIDDPVTDLALNGRAKGFRIWLTTQEAGTKAGTGKLDSYISDRIVYRPPNAGAGYRGSGVKNLDLTLLSPHKGDAFAVLGGGAVRCATGWNWDELLHGSSSAPMRIDTPRGFEVVEPHAGAAGAGPAGGGVVLR